MARRANWKQKGNIQKIASERISILFAQARAVAQQRIDLARRYVSLARKLGTRNKTSLSAYKGSFCKHCGGYFLPGKNARVRIHRGKIVIICQECKHITRKHLK